MGPQCCGLSCVRVPQSLQSCLTLCSPLGCSPPGPSVHGILQARILEWVAMPSSRRSSQPRDRTHISCISCVSDSFLLSQGGSPQPTTSPSIHFFLSFRNSCENPHFLLPLFLPFLTYFSSLHFFLMPCEIVAQPYLLFTCSILSVSILFFNLFEF